MWDKVAGLGHNGQRLASGAREVLFVGGDRQFISAAQWPGFVRGQEDLLEQKRRRITQGAPVMTGQFFFPSGSFRSSYDSPFELYGRLLPNYSKSAYVYFSPSSSRDLHGHALLRRGSALLPSHLTWYRGDVPTNGVMEYIIVFEGHSSSTVVVEFTNSMPDMPSILFQMCGTWESIPTPINPVRSIDK